MTSGDTCHWCGLLGIFGAWAVLMGLVAWEGRDVLKDKWKEWRR